MSSSARPGPRSRPQRRKATEVAKSTHRHATAIMESRPLLAIGISIVSTILSRDARRTQVTAEKNVTLQRANKTSGSRCQMKDKHEHCKERDGVTTAGRNRTVLKTRSMLSSPCLFPRVSIHVNIHRIHYGGVGTRTRSELCSLPVNTTVEASMP